MAKQVIIAISFSSSMFIQLTLTLVFSLELLWLMYYQAKVLVSPNIIGVLTALKLRPKGK